MGLGMGRNQLTLSEQWMLPRKRENESGPKGWIEGNQGLGHGAGGRRIFKILFTYTLDWFWE